MAARITLQAINDEMARLGYTARLARGSGYFYFQSGEAADWLDRTVTAPAVGSRTLRQWIEEFRRLQKLNRQILGAAAKKRTPQRRSPAAGSL